MLSREEEIMVDKWAESCPQSSLCVSFRSSSTPKVEYTHTLVLQKSVKELGMIEFEESLEKIGADLLRLPKDSVVKMEGFGKFKYNDRLGKVVDLLYKYLDELECSIIAYVDVY